MLQLSTPSSGAASAAADLLPLLQALLLISPEMCQALSSPHTSSQPCGDSVHQSAPAVHAGVSPPALTNSQQQRNPDAAAADADSLQTAHLLAAEPPMTAGSPMDEMSNAEVRSRSVAASPGSSSQPSNHQGTESSASSQPTDGSPALLAAEQNTLGQQGQTLAHDLGDTRTEGHAGGGMAGGLKDFPSQQHVNGSSAEPTAGSGGGASQGDTSESRPTLTSTGAVPAASSEAAVPEHRLQPNGLSRTNPAAPSNHDSEESTTHLPRSPLGTRPLCLFAACWTQHVPDRDEFELPPNVGLCGAPDAQITFDAAITSVDDIIDGLYGAGTASAWAGKLQPQDDESDDEAVEALTHALGEATIDASDPAEREL